MVTSNTKRLSKIARELNVGISTLVDFLGKKGIEISSNPNTKIDTNAVHLLEKEFSKDHDLKKESEKLNLRSTRPKKESLPAEKKQETVSKNENSRKKEIEAAKSKDQEDDSKVIDHRPKMKVLGKIDLSGKPKSTEKTSEAKKEESKPKAISTPKQEPKKPVENIAPEKDSTNKTTPAKEEKVNSSKGKVESKVEPQEPKSEVTKKTSVENNEVKTSSTNEKKAEKAEAKASEPAAKAQKAPPVVEKVDLDQSKKKEKKPEQKQSKPAPEKPKHQEEKMKSNSKEDAKATSANASLNKEVSVESKKPEGNEVFTVKREKLSGPTVVGKIELPVDKKTDKSSKGDNANRNKRKRKRISKEKVDINAKQGGQGGNRQGGNRQGQGQGGNRQGQGGNRQGQGGNRQGGQGGNRQGGQGVNRQGGQGGNRPNNNRNNQGGRGNNQNRGKRPIKKEVNEVDVQKQIKDTLARLTSKGKNKGAKHRRDKRAAVNEKMAQEAAAQSAEKNVIKVTEFVSVNELASLMDVSVTDVISTCMNLGMFVSINQRLDAETMSLVADEFNYTVDFISVEVQEAIKEEEDSEEDLLERAPIITVMGHVDHGKTSLLDHIRKANVIAGEAGGITQHIGAYNVTLDSGKKITFLDTPGHEAFTAMRARGAQVTDIAIIIVAADDNVMPQTKEAINHASAAGVPIVFAINKVDKPHADPERIKSELANMNYMVEEWGGKYQSHDISAKTGMGVNELLEKILLEAEMLELKANPEKRATGSIIESSLDRGRGYTSTLLVEAGTLRVGDVILAGQYHGHVKAMFNERNQRVTEVGPSEPALILGLNGAPQAGDKFNILESEREARQISNKREQLQREQGLRTQKHITLDEIGRRIAIGNFQELNVIVKGDVDGSIEALSDSLIKLSTDEIQVNIIHKAVGQISESDVMLATASNAIIVGFQVRPSVGARRIAEKEEIDIRLYSIIYDAIGEIKSAMEGMLSPEIKEEIVATVEIRETFKISKVGTIAGCLVRDGKITRNSQVRLIREGIVIYTGELGSLKRFKDDVKEVSKGYECGLNIANYNDIKVDDIVEAFEMVEVAKKL